MEKMEKNLPIFPKNPDFSQNSDFVLGGGGSSMTHLGWAQIELKKPKNVPKIPFSGGENGEDGEDREPPNFSPKFWFFS